MQKVIVFVNVDSFIVSHRLRLCLALRDAGLEVVVAAGDTGASRQLASHGLRFVPLPIDRGGTNPLIEARALAAVTALYRAERPDVVHHASPKAIIYGSLAARAARVPSIVNTMSGLGFAMIERPHDPPRIRALRATVTTLYRLALRRRRTWNVFQNPDQRALFLERGLVRESSTMLVRGSGVDTQRFRGAPLPDGDPVVMLPARLLWDKGIGEFVEAARTLKPRLPRVRFVLVGGEDAGNPARIPVEDVKRWQAEGVVEWWGHRNDMPEVFRQASLVVLPSYAEGMPLALAEGAATGRAIVTTDVPGCREVVIDGENGLKVPVRDAASLARAIETLITDRNELTVMGERGRQHVVTHLAIERVIDEMLSVYERALGRPLPRPTR